MRDTKWYDGVIDWYHDVEWFFARRWLNRTFGHKDYWGDFIQDAILREREDGE